MNQEVSLDDFNKDDLPQEQRPEVERVLKGADQQTLPEGLVVEVDSEAERAPLVENPEQKKNRLDAKDQKNDDIRTAISKMNLPQKVKLALFGNGIVRALLIRDTNKLIQTCVLKNPKLQLGEVEDFSRNTNCSEFVLRTISNSQVWMKSYKAKFGLVINPKTPIDVSLRWLKFLTPDHLKLVARSKQIPQVISVAAKKRLSDEQKKK